MKKLPNFILSLILSLILSTMLLSSSAMAVVSSTNNKDVYVANGSNVSWSYDFPIINAGDIQVYVTDLNGNTTQINSNFSVNTSSKVVTYPVSGSALATNYQVTLLRSEPLTQQTSYINQGRLPLSVIEQGMDKLTMINQQLQEQINRQPQASVNTTSSVVFPGSSPGLLIGWLGNGLLGNIANTSNPWLYSGSNIYYTNGNVGIGTSSPSYNLDVVNGGAIRTSYLYGRNNLVLFGDSTGTNGVKILTDGSIQAMNAGNNIDLVVQENGGDLFTNAWADYSASSTIAGIGSLSGKYIYYKKVGKTVFVTFYLAGISNALTITFTVPYAAASNPAYIQQPIITHTNSATPAIGQANMTSGSATVTCESSIGGNFTNGASDLIGNFWYQSI